MGERTKWQKINKKLIIIIAQIKTVKFITSFHYYFHAHIVEIYYNSDRFWWSLGLIEFQPFNMTPGNPHRKYSGLVQFSIQFVVVGYEWSWSHLSQSLFNGNVVNKTGILSNSQWVNTVASDKFWTWCNYDRDYA